MITGLPRSRTAWLANFFCTQDTYCYHELLGRCKAVEEYSTYFDNKYSYIGDSNTCAQRLPERLLKGIPLVVIHRDLEDVIDSSILIADKMLGHEAPSKVIEFLTRGLEGQQTFLDGLEGLHIDFQDIDKEIQTIWEYCVSTPFDNQRANELQKMNIQTTDFSYNKEVL